MPYADKDKKKEYNASNFHAITIRFMRTKDNDNMLSNLKEAAKNKGISPQKYMLLATREKLDRDGYI